MNPALPILLMSGYDEGEVAQRFVGNDLTAFVHKPFTPAALLQAVRTTLRARTGSLSGHGGDIPDDPGSSDTTNH
jgi:CheY-like chemotaxis protein